MLGGFSSMILDGSCNLQNNPEMISRMYEVWKSLATKVPQEIMRRSIFLKVFNTTSLTGSLINLKLV